MRNYKDLEQIEIKFFFWKQNLERSYGYKENIQSRKCVLRSLTFWKKQLFNWQFSGHQRWTKIRKLKYNRVGMEGSFVAREEIVPHREMEEKISSFATSERRGKYMRKKTKYFYKQCSKFKRNSPLVLSTCCKNV